MRTGDQVVQDLPWKWGVQGKIFIIGGLGYMFDAWDVALNGFLTPLLGTEFGLSTGQRGLVATANLVGMAVGAVAWGTVADRVGRKRAFSITVLIFALFSVLGALAPSWEIFLALRFLAGVGLGGCIPVDYALVSEFSPRKQRGRVLAGPGRPRRGCHDARRVRQRDPGRHPRHVRLRLRAVPDGAAGQRVRVGV